MPCQPYVERSGLDSIWHDAFGKCGQAAMQLSEEKQDKICSLFLDMMRRLDALFASQVSLQSHAYLS